MIYVEGRSDLRETVADTAQAAPWGWLESRCLLQAPPPRRAAPSQQLERSIESASNALGGSTAKEQISGNIISDPPLNSSDTSKPPSSVFGFGRVALLHSEMYGFRDMLYQALHWTGMFDEAVPL
jgi:hypothetical protein